MGNHILVFRDFYREVVPVSPLGPGSVISSDLVITEELEYEIGV